MSQPQAFSWGATAFGAGVINTLINAPIGWAMVPEGGRLSVWTIPGVVPDLIITAYAIAFGTALIVTPQTRKQVASGKLLPPMLSDGMRAHFAAWPHSGFIRGIRLGMLSVGLFCPLPLLALYGLGVQEVDRMTETLLKGGFSFIAGAAITPFIAAAATVAPKLQPAKG